MQLISHEVNSKFIKLFIDKLNSSFEKELEESLKADIFYEITILNIKALPISIILHLEKFKKNILLIVSEDRLKYYLVNLGFKVESSQSHLRTPQYILEKIDYIAIGGSAGSLKKFIEIVKYLPPSNLTVFIIMHQKGDVQSQLVNILKKYTTSYKVLDATDGLKVEKSSIYLAPSDKHMVVKDGCLRLDDGPLCNFSKPSVSISFSSLSKSYKEKLLAILVCGYGADGSDVLKEVRENGGIVFIEQLYECEATPMLENAIKTKQFDKILSIHDMLELIFEKIKKENSIELNIDKFLEDIFLTYGYDYRGYQKKHLQRRINSFYMDRNYQSFDLLRTDVLSKRKVFEELFLGLSINVTTFFRNPEVFTQLKMEIQNRFSNNNSIKIWCAGCSSGEEPYSVAIILKELGLLHKSIIYATDINDLILNDAKNGIYSNKSFQVFKEQYKKSGGSLEFDQYFNKYDDFVIIKKDIKDKVLFFKHNLSLDKTPGQFQVIICRNVLIYFNKNLTSKVFQLFESSMDNKSLLIIGESESVYDEALLEVVDERKKIFKKVQE